MNDEINDSVYIVILIINGVNFLPIFDVIFKYTNCASSKKAKLELSCYLALSILINTISYLLTNNKLTMLLQLRSFIGTYSEISIFTWITSITYNNTETHLSRKSRIIYLTLNTFLPFLITTLFFICNSNTFTNPHSLLFITTPSLYITTRLIELLISFTNLYYHIKHKLTITSYTTPLIQLLLLSLSITFYFFNLHSITTILFPYLILISLYQHIYIINTYN
jgi:hypothetical protein